MRRLLAAWLLMASSTVAQAADTPPGAVAVQGKPDGNAPGWVIRAQAPAGWTADCCTYARAIGVNLVIYRGEWTGEPERVMVLNVWPRKLATLGEELAADRKRYLQRDPAAKAGSFPVRHRSMQCKATVYEGTDRFDDVVVFCDPGRATGIRLSWSMTLADADPQRRALLEDFMRVVVGALYMHSEDATGHQGAQR